MGIDIGIDINGKGYSVVSQKLIGATIRTP